MKGNSIELLVCIIIIFIGSSISKTYNTIEHHNLNQQSMPVPIFLGLKIMNLPNSRLKSLGLDALIEIQRKFNLPEINKDIEEIRKLGFQSNDWLYPLEAHITSLYLGGVLPKDATNLTFYNSYIEDVFTSVQLKAVIYSPGNIIAAPAFYDRQKFVTMNRIPHTTLLNKGLSAVYSNNILESAYDLNEQFRFDYEAQFSNLTYVSEYDILINGNPSKAYVVPISQLFDVLTHKFYLA